MHVVGKYSFRVRCLNERFAEGFGPIHTFKMGEFIMELSLSQLTTSKYIDIFGHLERFQLESRFSTSQRQFVPN